MSFYNMQGRSDIVKALHQASELKSKYHDIFRSTVGVAFLGTPFQCSYKGLFTSAQLRIAVALFMGNEASDNLVQYLKADASGCRELDELVQRFRQMVADDKIRFPIICFYETQRTDFTNAINKLPLEFVNLLNDDNKRIVSNWFIWLCFHR
jgi:hypothetical protein